MQALAPLLRGAGEHCEPEGVFPAFSTRLLLKYAASRTLQEPYHRKRSPSPSQERLSEMVN